MRVFIPGGAGYVGSLLVPALLDAGYYPISFAVHLMKSFSTNVSGNIEFEKDYEVDISGTAMMKFHKGIDVKARWGFGMKYINEARIKSIRDIKQTSTDIEKAQSLKKTNLSALNKLVKTRYQKKSKLVVSQNYQLEIK